MSDARALHMINNQYGEIIEIYEGYVRIIVPKLGFWNKFKTNRPFASVSEGTYVFSLDDIQIHIDRPSVTGAYRLTVQNKNRPESKIKLFASSLRRNDWTILENYISEKRAKDKERNLDYEGAIQIYDSIEKPEEATRLRKLKAKQGAVKVDQTVVHGDYVDDRDTIVKDSVINRSNVGAGGDDKFARLEKLTEMKEKGLIDDDEFKKMKKEIIG